MAYIRDFLFYFIQAMNFSEHGEVSDDAMLEKGKFCYEAKKKKKKK